MTSNSQASRTTTSSPSVRRRAGGARFLGIPHGKFVLLSLIPILLLFMMLVLVPTTMAIYLSFFEYNLLRPSQPFIGLGNFAKMLDDRIFRISIANTVVFAAITLPLNIVLSLPIAVGLNRIRRLKTFFRTCFFLPTVTSLVAVSLIWLFLYDPIGGLINVILGAVGFSQIPWLQDPAIALPAVVASYVWRDLGYNIVVFLAALQGIPAVYYEAAKIDGSNGWHLFWRITVPLLRPVMGMVFILTVISAVKVFAPIQIMTDGGPLNATRVLVYYIYENAFAFLKMGYASSMAVVLWSIILVLSLVQWRLFRTSWEY